MPFSLIAVADTSKIMKVCRRMSGGYYRGGMSISHSPQWRATPLAYRSDAVRVG
jgi:hypothetical protein